MQIKFLNASQYLRYKPLKQTKNTILSYNVMKTFTQLLINNKRQANNYDPIPQLIHLFCTNYRLLTKPLNSPTLLPSPPNTLTSSTELIHATGISKLPKLICGSTLERHISIFASRKTNNALKFSKQLLQNMYAAKEGIWGRSGGSFINFFCGKGIQYWLVGW